MRSLHAGSVDLDTSEVVPRARAGDPAAVEALASRACSIALQTVSLLAADKMSAQDLAQDVTLDVLRGLEKLTDPSAFDGWVRVIAIRKAKRAYGVRKNRRDREGPMSGAVHLADARDGLGEAEIHLQLRAALGRLPFKERAVVVLRYVHDLPDAEIAAALRCRVGTVHSHLSRARRALREAPELQSLHQSEGATDEDRHRRNSPARLGTGPAA